MWEPESRLRVARCWCNGCETIEGISEPKDGKHDPPDLHWFCTCFAGQCCDADQLRCESRCARDSVVEKDLGRGTPVLELPCDGDTGYPGMAWHDGLLWISYYSSHEGKTSIYLAKIRLDS